MQARQANQLQSLRAARKFLDDNGQRLPGINDTGVRRTLDALITDLGECANEQEGSNREGLGETRRYQKLRRELVQHHMTIIARVAQLERTNTPELAVLSLPRGNPSPAKLAAAAHGMARAAAPYANVFIDAGSPPDFIRRLTDATDAMLASYTARSQRHAHRRGATVGLARKLRQGRLVLDVFTSFIESAAARGDAELLASWNMITHVRRITRRSEATAALLPHAAAEPAQLTAPAMKLLTSGEVAPPAETARPLSVIDAILKPFRRVAR